MELSLGKEKQFLTRKALICQSKKHLFSQNKNKLFNREIVLINGYFERIKDSQFTSIETLLSYLVYLRIGYHVLLRQKQ